MIGALRLLLATIALLAVTTPCTIAQVSKRTSSFRCRSDDIPTSWGFEGPPGQIDRLIVLYTELGTVWPDFYFRNLGSSPIRALSLVLEFTDKDGNIIDRVPVIAGTKDARENFQLPYTVERVAGYWDVPLVPDKTIRVQGVKNGIRTSVCPSQAKVTFLAVQLTDGSIRKYSAADWEVGPIPTTIPEAPMSLSEFQVPSQPQLLEARISIDSSGKPLAFVVDQGGTSQLNEILSRWFQSKWIFHPAIRNGLPVQWELRVLFRVNRDEAQVRLDDPFRSPVTVVNLVRKADNSGKWDVFYSQAREYTAF